MFIEFKFSEDKNEDCIGVTLDNYFLKVFTIAFFSASSLLLKI